MDTLPKEERLSGIRLISALYDNSSSFLCYPYKVNWRQENFADAVPVKVLFSVSKKRFKRAVDRNLLKRKMRECYRQQKQEFLFPRVKALEKQLLISLAYIGKELEDSDLMTKKMQKALQTLTEKIQA